MLNNDDLQVSNHVSLPKIMLIYFHVSCDRYIFSTIFIDNNLVPLTKTEFERHKTDAFNLEDIKKNGTASAEISPTCLLAGESSFYFPTLYGLGP